MASTRLWGTLREIVQDALRYEVGTLPGVINLVGLFVLAKLWPSVTVAELAMHYFAKLLEGSRRYRLAKQRKTYDPVYKEPRPKPETSRKSRTFAAVAGYFLLSVSSVSVIEHLG